MLSASLGQVGVVGQPTEQGGHHRAGVHLLLWRKGVSVREQEGQGSNWSEMGTKVRPLSLGCNGNGGGGSGERGQEKEVVR